MPFGRHFPQLLQADGVGLRRALIAQAIESDKLFRQRTATALGDQREFPTQLHPALVVRRPGAVFADADVAGSNASDAPPRAIAFGQQQFRGGKPRIDLDPERLGLASQPATHIAERDDVVALVVHLRRRREAQRSRGRQEEETILARRGEDRRAAIAPAGQQFIEGARLDHGARENVRADLAALLDDTDARFGGKLLQPYGGGETRRPCADDHDIEIHCLSLDGLTGRVLRHRFPRDSVLPCRP